MLPRLPRSFRLVLKRAAWLPPLLLAMADCGSNSGPGFSGGFGDDAGGSQSAYDATYSPPLGADGGLVVPDVDVPDVPMIYQAYDGSLVNAPGGCKPGHYTGSFTGTYSSFLTFVGVPIPVAGNVSLDLDQTSNGEFYTISNGFVSGTADLLFPYWCNIIGTLNCRTKQIDNGALRNCTYCVGGADIESGVCIGVAGHFNGPLTADYDSSIHAFVNGTWAGSEQVDAGAPVDAGGGCKIGPANYGGCGDWSAKLGP